MIKIDLPDFDLVVTRDKIESIPAGKTGLYFLFDEHEKLVYIGQSTDLKRRVKEHFTGNSGNTSRYTERFCKCSMFFEDNRVNVNIYEYYFIRTLEPELNKPKRFGRPGYI